MTDSLSTTRTKKVPSEMGAPATAQPRAVPDGALPGLRHAVLEFEQQQRRVGRLWQIIERINRGVGLEEILNFIYDEFRDVVPHDRVSYAAIDHAQGRVVARWARSEEQPRITEGYSLPLARTSLMDIVRTGRPRIIDDLKTYLRERPESDGSRRLVAEGMRSSLTCPLIVDGQPVGFLFFNSKKPAAYSRGHIEFLVQIAGVVAVVIERGRIHSELVEQQRISENQSRLLAEENRRHEQELNLARNVQRALIPHVLPDFTCLRLAMLYEPAASVGGDLLDCIALDHDTALVYVADAMGHGVPAALVMSVVRTAFHAALARQTAGDKPSPAALLSEVNRTVVELFGANYVTAVCARIDGGGRAVTLSLAGHPPALVLRRSTGEVAEIAARSIPLGISSDTVYSDTEMPFEPGDVLLMYTDAVTEAEAADDTCFGLGSLKELLRAARGGSIEALIERLRRDLAHHSGRADLEDDLTILAVEATSEAGETVDATRKG